MDGVGGGVCVGEDDTEKRLNTHLPNGFSHLYLFDKSIFHLKGAWCTFFLFIIFLIEIPVSKQCRP